MVASIGEAKRTFATRLTTVCEGLRLFCKRLRLFCKRLQLFAGKINSQRNFEHVQHFFATRKTVCDNKNCLRTCLQPLRTLTKPKIRYVRKHSPLQCNTPLTQICFPNHQELLRNRFAAILNNCSQVVATSRVNLLSRNDSLDFVNTSQCR